MSTSDTTAKTAPAAHTSATPPEHVVLGTGPVGMALTDALLARGTDPGAVRLVNRSGHRPDGAPAGVAVLAGDMHDPAFAVRAAAGARVVYQVLNPLYHRWAQEFPNLQANAVTAAQATGARLVTLDNTYSYGRPDPGQVLTEDSPVRAHTRKGAVRAAMHRDLMAAHHAGRVEVAVGRASDYYGPRADLQSPLGTQAMIAAVTNGKTRVLGDPNQPHTYTYLPDIGAGLALLGEHPDTPGHVWHLPNDPAVQSTRQMLDTLYRLAGHGAARVQPTPAFILKIVGLRQKAAAELVEMLYEFEEPYVIDSTRFTDKLGLRATPLDQALAATLPTYR